MWILPKNYPLSSHFAQAMVESKEDLSFPGLNIESSLMWRSKPTALQTWLRRWKRVSWLQHLFTRTLKPSHRSFFEERLASSRVAIPVNPFQRQGAEKERTTPDTSGHSYGDTLQQLDLIESSLKMSKVTSRLDCPQLLPTWKKMITEQRGEYSQRVKLAHHTKESEFTSWPTPMVQDSKHSGTNSGPNAKRQLLVNQVNWPTPRASEYKDCGPVGSKSQIHMDKRSYLCAKVKDPNMPLGMLNPEWVEWLMGVPTGWTALGSWGMASCLKQPQKHGGS